MASALEDLCRAALVWRGGRPDRNPFPTVPSGHAALDRELPGGGWPLGALVEILVDVSGTGELTLVLPSLVGLSRAGKIVLWVAPPHLPYAPALAACGLRLDRLVVLRPGSECEALWAAEQALRSAFGGALLVWLSRTEYAGLRRLAIAAEGNAGCAFVFRSRRQAGEPSPAVLRLALEGRAGDGLSLRLLKRRGAPLPGSLHLPLRRGLRVVDRGSLPGPASAGERPRECVG